MSSVLPGRINDARFVHAAIVRATTLQDGRQRCKTDANAARRTPTLVEVGADDAKLAPPSLVGDGGLRRDGKNADYQRQGCDAHVTLRQIQPLVIAAH